MDGQGSAFARFAESEGTVASLEQRYIALLEQRVAQLNHIVSSSSVADKIGNPAGNDNALEPDKDIVNASTSKTPLTKENLDKVANGTAKVNPTCDNPTKSPVRVRQVVAKYNETTGAIEEVPIENETPKDEGTKPSCVLRNVRDPANPRTIAHNEVDFGPGPLLDLMKEVMVDDDVDRTWNGQYVNLMTPFPSLVHKWDALKEAESELESDSPQRKEARADLKIVLDFVERSKMLEPYFKNRESHRSSKVVEYKYIWTIFPVGTEVIATTFMEEKQIMIVSDLPDIQPSRKSQSLWCWYYDHDGTDWIVAEVPFDIDGYSGTKAIDALPCYPLKYHNQKDDLEALKLEFTDRGRRFRDLCTAKPGVGQMFEYNGHLLSVENSFRSQRSNEGMDDQSSHQGLEGRALDSGAFKKAFVNGKIQVDPKSFLEQAPLGGQDMWLGERAIYFVDTRERRHEIPEEKKFLIAPPRVLGWSSVRKSWCGFIINEVKQAKTKGTIFEDQLQLDPEVKAMIRALITQHNNQLEEGGVESPDLIEGKGRGLVIMLHGPPGVGKTLTAEAIAEKTMRPLLIVSVAQIGLDASKAERNLERMFQLASRWEAILLVDEADVFLETRDSQANPNRNALVSGRFLHVTLLYAGNDADQRPNQVLLRVLEYYKGIMILTTNRITSLDAAVQSRIHLAVRFDELNQTHMQNVLATILGKFKVKENDKENIMASFKEYLKDSTNFKLNGREIRNVVFSAHAMALSKNRTSIVWSDIREVLRVTREFQDQLKKVTTKQRLQREASIGIE